MANFEDFYDNLKTTLSEPAPCDNCMHAKWCKEEEVACRIFARYIEDGKFPKDFDPVYRHPNRQLYIRIFENDETLAKELREDAKKMQEAKDKGVKL